MRKKEITNPCDTFEKWIENCSMKRERDAEISDTQEAHVSLLQSTPNITTQDLLKTRIVL